MDSLTKEEIDSVFVDRLGDENNFNEVSDFELWLKRLDYCLFAAYLI